MIEIRYIEATCPFCKTTIRNVKRIPTYEYTIATYRIRCHRCGYTAIVRVRPKTKRVKPPILRR